MSFDQVAWLPLCAGLTALGLVLSWVVGRRRGAAAALRGIAWSLLPVAAYLTGVLPLVWDTATAVASWVAGLIFSPRVWVGAGLVALSALFFFISGLMRGRTIARGRSDRARATEPQGSRQVEAPRGTGLFDTPDRKTARQPAAPRAGAAKAGAAKPDTDQTQPLGDDDFAEVEEILRRRGIT
jgi:hypothetical protein